MLKDTAAQMAEAKLNRLRCLSRKGLCNYKEHNAVLDFSLTYGEESATLKGLGQKII